MRAWIARMTEDNIDQSAIEKAGEILKNGGLAAFPTETVYGLGGNALDAKASEKIYAAKGRPSDNPLIVHIGRMEDLETVAANVPESARKLAAACWPGPLTMIFEKTNAVPLETTGGLTSVAVRYPSNKVANALILAGGGFIAAPSANTSGRPSPTKAEHVIEDLGDKIDCIIDGGDAEIGLESTIVDFTEEIPTILRPGYYNKEMLEKVLGTVRVDPGILAEDSHVRPKAPGMRYKHYAPKADLTIIQGEMERVIPEINRLAAEQEKAGKKVGVICTDETREQYTTGDIKSIGLRAEDETIAHHLFAILRDFDEDGVEVIYSEAFDTRILFVDADDTARAPMAKAILQSKELPWPMEIGSRGLVVLFPQPVNQKVEAVLARNGLSAKDHTTTPLTAEDINDDTLLLVMEDSQREKIREDFPDAPHLQTIAGFLRLAGDIPALYGEPLTEYGKCYEALEFLIEGVLARLKEEEEQ